jgi:hypothetical protein
MIHDSLYRRWTEVRTTNNDGVNLLVTISERERERERERRGERKNERKKER